MSVTERLQTVLATLGEGRLQEVLSFAEFLRWRDEHRDWEQFGKNQLARAYGPNEPEYSPTDLLPEHRP